MPIYEYICRSCGKSCELLLTQSKRDEAGLLCPNCGEAALERLISVTAKPKCECGSCGQGSCGSCSGGGCSCG